MTTTVDAFLGGKLQIEQPKHGYRAGVDPVLLAASCPVRDGDHVLDLGCGVGTAGLCLATRAVVVLAGVELDPLAADLARANATRNGVTMDVAKADATGRPTPFYDRSFDVVLTNPPFFPPSAGTKARDSGRAQGRAGQVDLAAWIGTAYKRLKPRGYLVMIQRTDRLPDVLAACQGFGDIQILPIVARAGRIAEHFLLKGRKDAKAPFRLLSPLIMHEGAAHPGDRPNYTPAVEAVLRHGADLPWGD